MTGLGLDIRTAIRAMVRRPFFTLTCIVTLAVGIGSTTAVFTVVNAVILRSLRYPEPQRLVRVFTNEKKTADRLDSANGADFLDWRAQSTSFEALAGFATKNVNLTGTEFPIRIRGASVTPEFFAVLGTEPAFGRVLSPDTDRPEGEPAVVVSDGFWRSHLGADPAVIGSSLRLNGRVHTVVGVMPAGFAYPAKAEFWASSPFRVPEPPFNVGEDPAENRGAHYFNVIGRLRQGVGLAQAQAEMAGIADRLAREYPDTNFDQGIVIRSLRDTVIGDARPRLLLLLAATGFVLLIACINVAGMLLARATERSTEIGLRLAIGAERRRIVRLFFTEGLMLAVAGGVIGTAIALFGTKALLAMAPDALPRSDEVVVDPRVLGFAILVVAGTSVVFGLAPAVHSLRRSLGPVVSGGRGRPALNEGKRLRNGLVVAEVASSLLLVVGTGLMVRTFVTLSRVDPGFESRGLLAAHVALSDSAYREDHDIIEFQSRVLEKLRALPGVVSASTVLTLPMHWNILGELSFVIEGLPEDGEDPPQAGYQVVDPEYFATMRIPLLSGRLFNDGDSNGAPDVALVNRSCANHYWPDEDPIGKRISWGSTDGENRDWVTIVGVVEDAYVEGLDTPPRMETYRPFAQDPYPYLTLVLRTRNDPAAFAGLLRQAVLEIDPQQPISGLKTMDEVLSAALVHRRFNMLLMGVFAGAGLLLAAVGLYGMLSFSISRRYHEIGVRRALGAQPRDIAFQFISEGARMLVIGLAVGTAGALALAHLITTQIYGVTATDPVTYIVAALLLAAVGLLASYLPARRAARVEPMTVLRSD